MENAEENYLHRTDLYSIVGSTKYIEICFNSEFETQSFRLNRGNIRRLSELEIDYLKPHLEITRPGLLDELNSRGISLNDFQDSLKFALEKDEAQFQARLNFVYAKNGSN